jgi:hypothetical protein
MTAHAEEAPMTGPKTRPTEESVSNFLGRISEDSKRKDCQEVAEWMRLATGTEPVMWGTDIVGFGRYRKIYATGREGEWPIIAFSPRKSDITLYIMLGFDRCEDLMSRLGTFKTGKSCLHVKRLADVDSDALRELIGRAVGLMAKRRVDR